jgi:hypothetical protein
MPTAVDYVEPGPLPRGLDSRSLRRRALQIAAVLVILGVVAALAPGLGDVRQRLEGAQPGWLGVAIVLELLSCLSYVLLFRPIFCARMSLRTSYQLAMSQLAVGSLVPASGALDWPSVPGRCARVACPCRTSLAARWRSSPSRAR